VVHGEIHNYTLEPLGRKQMEECLTCKCGCQEWNIFSDRFECLKCGHGYYLARLSLNISYLNGFIKGRLVEPEDYLDYDGDDK